MKKVILILLVFSLFLSGCVTSRMKNVTSHNMETKDLSAQNRDLFKIKGNVSYNAVSPFKLWILFIPFGGSSDRRLYSNAYSNLLKKNNCDGILNENREYKKVTVPLLFITYVYKQLKISGIGYKIKTDSIK